MQKVEREIALREFRKIPSIGKKLAEAFVDDLGFREVRELKSKDPNDLYLKLCAKRNEKLCRCVLYITRCVVAYAEKPHNKNWWDFK
jgi:hypothetical protein